MSNIKHSNPNFKGNTWEEFAIFNVKLTTITFIFSLGAFFWTQIIESPPCSNLGCAIGCHIIVFVIILIFGKLMFELRRFEVIWRASVIGIVFSMGLWLSTTSDILSSFGFYLCTLSFFHVSEYLATGLTNPSNLKTDSFLLNHSLQYWIAAMASWTEYFIELYFVGQDLKNYAIIRTAGLILCLIGEFIRKTAMFHAGQSFSHIVQNTKQSDHVLVQDGIFSLVRHPSYVGWMLWSVGTQILLANPICLCAYTYVTWVFFNERIYIEEFSLLQFFGEDYVKYQDRVAVGIPFIKGYMHR